MSCPAIDDLLDAYFDGELGFTESRRIEAHLNECSQCAALVETRRRLRRSLRQPGVAYQAPVQLRRSLRTARIRRYLTRPGFALAAASAIVLLAGFWIARAVTQSVKNQALTQGIVGSYIRSLQANHLFDVASTDQHTVKPWFAGKLDFAPTVKDLNAEGFLLVGGRLDYIAARPAAVLVYKRRQHVISLMEWPGMSGASQTTVRGYQLLHWSAGGMTFWAISDINMPELEQFKAALQ